MQCLAKSTAMYFTESERRESCRGAMLSLLNFWAWHPQGKAHAIICAHHGDIIRTRVRSSFVCEKIEEALRTR